jgi:AcrR family transcriptional regulator
MRVEDIAALSGVNKTTIYRRWPTKAELLTNAVIEHAKKRLPPIDTGSVRGDLRASLLSSFDLRPYEQGVLRVIQMERSLEEVEAFAQRMRDGLRNMRMAIVRRGIERGELPAGIDVSLVVDLLSAPVQLALLVNHSLDGTTMDRMLELVLAGAAELASSKQRKPERGRAVHTPVEPARARVTSRSAAAARRQKKR